MDNNSRIGTIINKAQNDFSGVSNTTFEDCPIYKTDVKNGNPAWQCNWSWLFSDEPNSMLTSIFDEFTYICVMSRYLTSTLFNSNSIFSTNRDGCEGDSVYYNPSDAYNLSYIRTHIGCGEAEELSASPAPQTGEWVIVNIVRDSVNTSLYLNGELCQTVSNYGPMDFPVNYLDLGGFAGYLGDIFIYSRVLDTDELQQLNDYLDEKWAISSGPLTVLPFVPTPPLNFSIISYEYGYTDFPFDLTIEYKVINLAWDSAPGATSYNVYRDGILRSSLTATSYPDLRPFEFNTEYTYWVTAVNSEGESRASVEDTFFTTPF